ncbi:DUF4142 domain-containing protein [Gemmatimonas sp.]|uniref:DUF4142 domain-containing protein n=1 Tax=Gemmatimonas sp. TaxID=1962908 RepID=UPI00286A338B|nr:DUF4142 domain-containing protein [Gemmatimonas sp.]
MSLITRTTLLLSTLAIVAACGDKKSENTMADSTAMTADTTAMAPAEAAPLTDPNIVYILDQASASDSARGALAQTKATSKDVQDFGKMMVGEHHGLRTAGLDLAKKLSVTPMAPAGDQSETMAAQEMSLLESTAKGAAWDKAYIDYEVTYHQAVLETATKALGIAQNQELKDLISTAAPVLQKHLDRALELQKKMSAM